MIPPMKKALLFLAGIGLSIAALAQAQHPFICTTEGARLRYVSTDAKGKETGSTEVKILKVVSSGDSFTITQQSQLYIAGNAFTDPVQTVTTVKDGDVAVDFGGLGIAAEGAGFVLPRQMEVGLELPTGEATVEMLGIKSKQDITFHQVVSREELTVPAGTYDCYVVERRFTAKVLGLKANGSTKTWYARGIGAVRMDNYDKKGKLTSSQVLQDVTLP